MNYKSCVAHQHLLHEIIFLASKAAYERGLETVTLFPLKTDYRHLINRGGNQTPSTLLLKKDFSSTGSFTQEDFVVGAKGRVHAMCIEPVSPP